MESKKITFWILHAGINHKSPYFYNLCNEFSKHKNIKVVVKPELPLAVKEKNGVVYFNRLKRYYDSEDINSINDFIYKIDILKQNGWKLIFTLHNFFPIDRKTTKNDEILLRKFLEKMDLVFTFSDYMKNKLKEYFGIDAINHSIGENILNKSFDKKVNIPKLNTNSFVFTFIGNICEYKMIDTVIKNFKKIKNSNVYLIIAGPSSSNYKINYEINSNIIRIDDFIGDNSWKKLCAITNVFINSYDKNRKCFKYGFFPSNCIQIMSQKKICIVPDCKEIHELLPLGYYYSYKNNFHLYKVMKQVIYEKENIMIMEKTYPDCNYSWENMVNIIVSAVEKQL